MDRGILRVEGAIIVDGNSKPIILKGAGLGGHLNMENFITGYTGHEFEFRREMLRVLGEEKGQFFFDRLLEYFWTDSDAQFFASLGLNCLRIPINYRHFEDDANPGVYKAEGFKRLDRIIDICANHKIYTILDLHTAPGGQNQAWHCDSGIHKALFWEHKCFQDRFVELWKVLAAHYNGNPWIAGYNPLNEPGDEQQWRLQAFYSRVEKAIRSVDPHHILFLDGNSYSKDFSAFSQVLPNCVYAIHDYSNYGFPQGERYKRTPAQQCYLRESYDRKCEFMSQHHVPIWNGEFGPVYAASNDQDAKEINEERIYVLADQLKIYEETKISWSIWTYKDIGFQGMVIADPTSPYIQLLKPFLEKKKRLGLDSWGRDDQHVDKVWRPVVEHLNAEIPEAYHKGGYPFHWGLTRHLARNVREMFMSDLLMSEFADYFAGKSKEELDVLAASFKFENCILRHSLNETLKANNNTDHL